MTIILSILLVGIFMLLAFFMGVKLTQQIYSDREVSFEVNPIKVIQEERKAKERAEKLDKIEREYQINLENIENYNGDATGQKDF